MKRISSIRITGKVTYQIAYTDIIRNDSDLLGICDPNTKTILIKEGQTESMEFNTILHEILHAIDMESKKPIGLTEKQVLSLEKGIVRVLKLNGLR